MPNSSNRGFRRGQEEKGRIGKITEKSKSFHGQALAPPAVLRRPKTQPDLYSGRNMAGVSPAPVVEAPRLTKLLLNVTVQRSLGPVQVLMPPDATVGDLVREAVRSYGKEGRRPLLPTVDPAGFDLHYSQFSLESKETGFRNCPYSFHKITKLPLLSFLLGLVYLLLSQEAVIIEY